MENGFFAVEHGINSFRPTSFSDEIGLAALTITEKCEFLWKNLTVQMERKSPVYRTSTGSKDAAMR
jgi:hypothetical protein